MAELLIEILTEEVPFNEHKNQTEASKKFFLEKKIGDGEPQIFSTPNRLVIIQENIPLYTLVPSKKYKGPSIFASSSAVEGFLNRLNITKDALTSENNFYIYEAHEHLIETASFLPKILLQLLDDIAHSFTKTMKWNASEKRWIRPILNIMAIFEEKPVECMYAGVTSCSQTFIKEKAYAISNFIDYKNVLERGEIILDAARRKNIIEESIKRIEEEYNLQCLSPPRLFMENVYLSEYPKLNLSQFDKKYLDLPSKVLIESLQKNQKYFLFEEKTRNDGKSNILSSFFAVCINGNFPSKIERNILEGNKKVLNARLEDAFYYIKIDSALTLKNQVERLKKVDFHKACGSVYDRIPRMLAILDRLKQNMKEDLIEDLRTAITFCKADLTTEMIQNFPELQGYIGAFYARKEGVKEEIAIAIENHYSLGSASIVQGTPQLSLFLALIEKYEKVITLLNADEIPTSSRDPYAIRKEILCIARIIIGGKISISLPFTGSFKEILLDRLAVYLKEPELKRLLPEKETNSKEFSIMDITDKVNLIKELRPQLLNYKRINNILNSSEAAPFRGGEIDFELLTSSEKEFLEQFPYSLTLEEYAEKSIILESFFLNHLVINPSLPDISKNRMAILENIANNLSQFINLEYFS